MASDPATSCKGAWYPPGSGHAQPAFLRDSGGVLEITIAQDGAQVSTAKVAEVEVSPRVGDIPRKLSLPDGSLFETTDNAAIDGMLRAAGGGFDFVHWLAEFRLRLAVVIIVTMGLLAGLYKFGLPILVDVAVYFTPPAVPKTMSVATIAMLDRSLLGPSTLPNPRQDELKTDFQQLASFAATGQQKFALEFRHGGAIGPNAFALPDGTIIVTDELVDLAGTDRDQVMGVLGHEIGHVVMKHSLRQLFHAAGTYGILMFVTGDVGSGVENLISQGGGLLALSYSRDDESQADRYSVQLMRKAGRDPLAIGRFFKAIMAKLGSADDASILRTHPGTAAREAAIAEYLKELTCTDPNTSSSPDCRK